MVEGDGCHRVAAEHRKWLVGRRFKATSPNKRFAAGARLIMKAGGFLQKIEVHGKNMFYFFGKKGGKSGVVMHVHFGMAGAFAVYKEEAPETTPSTRLRLEDVETTGGKPRLCAHLSAMTVEHGTVSSLYARVIAKLGPDPLREDAEPSRFLAFCAAQKSNKNIGAVLMDQSALAGVGNIYRTETLYEAGIHPEQPANTLSVAELTKLWNIIVKQMQDGFKTGSIWGKKSGPQCYDRSNSACGGTVKEWTMGGRNVFACSKRQQLDARRQPTAQTEAIARSGTKHMGRMVPAAAAEDKKRRSGEGLAVQHVALKDDKTLAGVRAAKAAGRKRPPLAGANPSAKRVRAAKLGA